MRKPGQRLLYGQLIYNYGETVSSESGPKTA
jgi:hypothetical protein